MLLILLLQNTIYIVVEIKQLRINVDLLITCTSINNHLGINSQAHRKSLINKTGQSFECVLTYLDYEPCSLERRHFSVEIYFKGS